MVGTAVPDDSSEGRGYIVNAAAFIYCCAALCWCRGCRCEGRSGSGSMQDGVCAALQKVHLTPPVRY
jgi:hypothetical protein